MSPKIRETRKLEDALEYLPRRETLNFRRGQVIYDHEHPGTGLYLVVDGRVKVSVTMEDGSQTVTGVFCRDDFFGEYALLGEPEGEQRSTAIEDTTLMRWSRDEIEDLIERQPRLGMALLETVVERCLDLQDRLQSMALEKTPYRVANSMLGFAERFGTATADGAVRIPPFTHQLLSEYIGTSREIVTYQMNQLRNQGFLRYSRKSIEVFPDALREHLRQQKKPVPASDSKSNSVWSLDRPQAGL